MARTITTPKGKPLFVRLSPDLRKLLEEEARRDRRSLAQQIATILEDRYKQKVK